MPYGEKCVADQCRAHDPFPERHLCGQHPRQADRRCHAVSLARGQPVTPGSRLPSLHAQPRRNHHAHQEAAGPGAPAGAESRQSTHRAPPRPHRAREQQCQALPYRPRHQPPPESGRPRSSDGNLLCVAQLSGTSHPVASDGLIEMNSILKENFLAI